MMTRISILLFLSLLSSCATSGGTGRPGATVSNTEPAPVRDAAEAAAPIRKLQDLFLFKCLRNG